MANGDIGFWIGTVGFAVGIFVLVEIFTKKWYVALIAVAIWFLAVGVKNIQNHFAPHPYRPPNAASGLVTPDLPL
jgi:hypothetical protein